MRAASASAELSSRDRREARRAVHYGRAVDDPALARAAIERAREVRQAARRWTLRTPDGWPPLLAAYGRNEAWMAMLPMVLILPWIRDPVTIGLEALFAVLLVHMLVRYARHAPVLAAQSEVANRALLGEPVAPGELGERLPWWRWRGAVLRSKPEVAGWLPIPLGQLVPVWVVWAIVVVVVGLTVPGYVQMWLPVAYLAAWIEVERRLAERVEERLGVDAARRARSVDVFRSGRGWPWTPLYVLLLVAIGAMAWGIAATDWFKGHGIGASFGFLFLLMYVYRDLASRWRFRHAGARRPR